jgi:hypothetical protein
MTRLSTLPSHREQAHHALVLLGVPAAARLVVEVHSALFDGDLSVPALAALLRGDHRLPPPAAAFQWSAPVERDGRHGATIGTTAFHPGGADDPATTSAYQWSAPVEQEGGDERAVTSSAFQWRPGDRGGEAPAGPDAPATAAPRADAGRQGGTEGRPYVICPGLHPDLTAAPGVVTLSTWAVGDRICTPAVARAEALVATVRVAEFVAMRPGASAMGLLRRLAESVPGGPEVIDALDPGALAEAARRALADPALAAAVAAEAPVRAAAAERAGRLDERQRLFGITGLPRQRGGA